MWNVEGQVDSAAFPRFREARCVRVVQNEGDAIFVPSGWWHQVGFPSSFLGSGPQKMRLTVFHENEAHSISF